jgi:hypothetical protein
MQRSKVLRGATLLRSLRAPQAPPAATRLALPEAARQFRTTAQLAQEAPGGHPDPLRSRPHQIGG